MLSKLLRSKAVVLSLLAIAFIIVGESTVSYPLGNRAIVVGVGIDKTADGIKASTQILASLSAGSGTPTNDSFIVVSGEGATMGQAMYDINNNNGAYISMGHCQTIFVSEELMRDKDAAYEAVEHLVHNYKTPENCLLVVTEESAESVLSQQTVSSMMASLDVKEISSSTEDVARTVKETVLSYRIGYNNPMRMQSIPYLVITQQFKDPADAGESNVGESGGVSIDMQSTFMSGLREAVVIDKYDTEVLNLITKDFHRGRISITSEEFEYSEKSVDVSVSLEGGEPVADIKLSIQGLSERYHAGYSKDGIQPQAEPKLEEEVNDAVNELFIQMSDAGIDAYELYGKFYKQYGEFAQKYSPETFLSQCRINVSTDIIIKS